MPLQCVRIRCVGTPVFETAKYPPAVASFPQIRIPFFGWCLLVYTPKVLRIERMTTCENDPRLLKALGLRVRS